MKCRVRSCNNEDQGWRGTRFDDVWICSACWYTITEGHRNSALFKEIKRQIINNIGKKDNIEKKH